MGAPFDINEWLDDLERAVEQAGPIYDRIADAAVRALWIIPWPFKDEVADALSWALQQLANAIVDLVQVVVELLQGAVFPILAFQYAGQWDAVRDTTDDVAATLGDLPLEREVGWAGDAASIYRGTVLPDQGAAVGAVATTTEEVGETLRTLGLATGGFYVGVALVIAAWIAEMSAAAAATATGVGAPAGVAGGTLSTVKTIGLITAAISAITAFANGSLTAFNRLDGQLQGPPFRDGAWPQAVP